MADSDIPEWAKKSLEEHDTRIARLEGLTDRLDAMIRLQKEELKKHDEEIKLHKEELSEIKGLISEKLMPIVSMLSEIQQDMRKDQEKLIPAISMLSEIQQDMRKDQKRWKFIFGIILVILAIGVLFVLSRKP